MYKRSSSQTFVRLVRGLVIEFRLLGLPIGREVEMEEEGAIHRWQRVQVVSLGKRMAETFQSLLLPTSSSSNSSLAQHEIVTWDPADQKLCWLEQAHKFGGGSK